MLAYTEPHAGETNGPRGAQVALMTIATLATVTLVAATLAWRGGWGAGAGRPGTTGTAADAGGVVLASAAVTATVSPGTGGGAADPDIRAEAPSPADAPVVMYIVATPAQAELMGQIVAEQVAILAQLGRGHITITLLIVDDERADPLAALPGPPDATTIDLRDP